MPGSGRPRRRNAGKNGKYSGDTYAQAEKRDPTNTSRVFAAPQPSEASPPITYRTVYRQDPILLTCVSSARKNVVDSIHVGFTLFLFFANAPIYGP